MRKIALLCSFLILVGCSEEQSKPIAPSESEIRAAASHTILKFNDDIQKIAQECQGQGAIIVNPLKAMKCTSVCSFDPKECKNIPKIELSDFKKLACEKAVGQAGWVCDYQYQVSSDSEFIMGMFESTYGTETRSQGRFIKSEDGSWILVGNGS